MWCGHSFSQRNKTTERAVGGEGGGGRGGRGLEMTGNEEGGGGVGQKFEK